MSKRVKQAFLIILMALAIGLAGCDRDYNLSNNMEAATENLQELDDALEGSPIDPD